MKRIAIFGDLHFGIGGIEFLESQINYLFNVALKRCAEEGVNTLVFLGDVFDNRKTIDVLLKNKVIDFFENVVSEGFEVKIILGNHDVYYRNSNKVNSLRPLKNIKNVEIFETTTEAKLLGLPVLYVPWLYDLKEFGDFVYKCQPDKFKVVFGHFDIIGYKMNRFKISNVGLDSGLVERFSLVISGHYHSKHSQKNKNGTVLYAGTPYQLDRGDIGEERGFHFLDLSTGDLEFVRNDVSPRFVQIKFGDELNDVSGNMVDILVEKKEDILKEEFENFVENIKKLKPFRQPQMKFLTEEKEALNGEINDLEFKSVISLLLEYIEKSDLKEEVLEKVKSNIVALYNDCSKENL